MLKRVIPVLLCLCMVLSLVACGGSSSKTVEVPDYVKSLQHKIDKALESTPSYDKIAEIKREYNDLLKSEQAMIKNYDKINALNPMDIHTVASIVAVKKLKAYLKDPNSLTLLSVSSTLGNQGVGTIKLTYTASNSYGGTVTEEWYYQFLLVKQDNGKWECKVGFTDNTKSSQNLAKDAYTREKSLNSHSVDVQLVMNNLDLSIKTNKPG